MQAVHGQDFGLKGIIPDDIANLEQLTVLDLRFNKITKLTDSIGRLSNLQVLRMNGNNLNVIPHQVGDLINLTALDFAYNNISIVPNTICNLINLQSLELFVNWKISSLPENLAQLTNLKNLIIGNNKITNLPPGIENIQPLERLYVSSNNLSFEILERFYYSNGNKKVKHFAFNDQGIIGKNVTLESIQNEPTVLHSPIKGEYTHWQWQKLDGSAWIDISGATDSLLTYSNIQLIDSGQYRCKATNDRVINLILYSAPITVRFIGLELHAIASGAWDDPGTWSPIESGSPGAIIPNPNSEVYIDGFEVEVTSDAECKKLIINNQQQAARLSINNGKLSIIEGLNVFNDHPSNPESKVEVSGNGAMVIAEQ